MLYGETPNVHMHTLRVAVIELAEDCWNFDIEEFRRAIRARLYKLEPFCYQLVNIPFKLHHPMWREHCAVDLTYHIRPWRLSAPGGRRELDEAIEEIASTPLDRSRPLWEMYFIEGLADNRIAVITKIHHALGDGVGTANLVARGMDLLPGPEGGPYLPDPVPTKWQLMRLAFADHVCQAGRIPRTLSYTAQSLARVCRSSRRLSAIQRPLAPPRTFMNHIITSAERRFATTTLALADVKQTSRHLGVTINDLVLAMSTGALRTLLLRYDGKTDPLLAHIPINRSGSPADRISGNYADGLLVELPVDLEDPLERVRHCHEGAISAKDRYQLRGPGLASRWLTYLPPVAAHALCRLASSRKAVSKMPNLAISNVPYYPERGRVGGTLVTEIYGIGPLSPWSGLVICVQSYVDQLSISVLTDNVTVKDPHELTAAMKAEFIEIRWSAGLSE